MPALYTPRETSPFDPLSRYPQQRDVKILQSNPGSQNKSVKQHHDPFDKIKSLGIEIKEKESFRNTNMESILEFPMGPVETACNRLPRSREKSANKIPNSPRNITPKAYNASKSPVIRQNAAENLIKISNSNNKGFLN